MKKETNIGFELLNLPIEIIVIIIGFLKSKYYTNMLYVCKLIYNTIKECISFNIVLKNHKFNYINNHINIKLIKFFYNDIYLNENILECILTLFNLEKLTIRWRNDIKIKNNYVFCLDKLINLKEINFEKSFSKYLNIDIFFKKIFLLKKLEIITFRDNSIDFIYLTNIDLNYLNTSVKKLRLLDGCELYNSNLDYLIGYFPNLNDLRLCALMNIDNYYLNFSFIDYCKNLTHLSLLECSINDEALLKLCKNNIPKLEYLSLDFNFFDNETNLDTFFYDLNLKHLSLSYNGKLFNLNFISKLTKLTYLNFSTDKHFSSILTTNFPTSLTYLKLTKNEKTIESQLFNLNNLSLLKILDLSYCHFFDDLKMNCLRLDLFTNLLELNLSNCYLKSGKYIFNCFKLIKLELVGNDLRSNFIKSITCLTNLTELNLSKNPKLGCKYSIVPWQNIFLEKAYHTGGEEDEFIQFFSDEVDYEMLEIVKLTKIKTLKMRQTRISDKTFKEFTKLINLKILDISRCDNIDESIYDIFGKYRKLRYLNLKRTRFAHNFYLGINDVSIFDLGTDVDYRKVIIKLDNVHEF